MTTQEAEARLWATSWVEKFDHGDGGGPVARTRLVIVEAESPLEARRESGLIEHDFREPTDDEMERWDEITARQLTDRDVNMIVRLLAREQKVLSRGRAKHYAETHALTTRGIGKFVLTPKGIAFLRDRGVHPRGNDASSLIDLLVREGVPYDPAAAGTVDHYRARVIAELRGKVEALPIEGEEEE